MSILLFIVILLGLIVVHELGHFITAKWAGIRVDEFGIGFPPRALTFYKKGETIYTLNWLPFGGFVRIFGEDPEEVTEDHPERARALVGKPWYVQVLVLSAGVGMNILAAWVLFSIAFMVGVPATEDVALGQMVENAELTVLHVVPGSPAAMLGIKPGLEIVGVTTAKDVLVELTPERVVAFIQRHSAEPIALSYRDGEAASQTVTITPVKGIVETEPQRAAIGVSMGVVGELQLPPHLAVLEGAKQTGAFFWGITVAIGGFFAQALMLDADLSQVAGPVGIVSLVGDAASLGIVSLLTFTAIISLHLAVINLLPIPALDGGRLLFVLIEAMKGSPIKPSIARTTNTVGFVLLIVLMLIVTISDVARLVS